MAQPASEMNPTLVFVPSLRVDRGMGHLRRCLSAAAAAGPGAAVFYSSDPAFGDGRPVFDRLLVRGLADSASVRLWTSWPEDLRIATVVADLQAGSEAAFAFLRQRSVRLVGWDDGGPARGRFPFLVDSLPHETQPEPNVRIPGLLGLSPPVTPHPFDRPIQRILAAFGGADPAGLTLRFLAMVDRLKERGLWNYELTVVRGPLSQFIVPEGVEVLEAPRDLAQRLVAWDLVITSWGLTALEALAVGTPVVLLNPSSYHEALSRAAKLPTFGVRRPRTADFLAALEDAPSAARAAAPRLVHPPVAAGPYFAGFEGSEGRCPVCRTEGHPVFARTEHKSYHLCATCGMEYLSVHQLPEKVYSDAYFFEDYQKQYGKTYLQDFGHIQSLGHQRLAFLDKTFGVQPGRRILDAGCAFGPFLAAAAEVGHVPFGLDIAEAPVAHVRQVLGFPAVQASLTDFQWESAFPGTPRPDVVTLWYVIEHFPDLDRVLRQISSVLEVGGLLAFSTPNGQGITRRFDPSRFWRESPDDHFSIWNPKNAKTVLARYGFEVAGFRITGHHPERFPGLKGTSGPLHLLVALLDRWLGWGDTFEVYARKIQELP